MGSGTQPETPPRPVCPDARHQPERFRSVSMGHGPGRPGRTPLPGFRENQGRTRSHEWTVLWRTLLTSGEGGETMPTAPHLLNAGQLGFQLPDGGVALVSPLGEVFVGGFQLRQPALQLLGAALMEDFQLLFLLLVLLLVLHLRLRYHGTQDHTQRESTHGKVGRRQS